ncbi:MAG: cobalamin-binding protein [Bacteroidetes bacterium]|nr:cobalamin-binding protein [Rhodothermia bacterium]MCS7154194.1 cobalamin-binding protein [Bacteroidota bacterium]MCX7906770.1 cobalamin-binding protein [Bacteroidota bacterium]MDW8136950.1 cobalamin-binding protein [Bacteroidota bacterium]MDW8285179.1 cobalamin-binding protein [Bacteroidota bacterium]
MRAVSLLPSATEIVCALGLGDHLVGRSHECDHPPWVRALPALTYSTIAAPGELISPAEIDRRVSEALQEGRSLYGLDRERLLELRPDLIITQALCDVCAVSLPTLERELQLLAAEHAIRLVSLQPADLEGVLASILELGEALGALERAQSVVASLRARLRVLNRALKGLTHRPRVVALEWLDPPFAPGHWVPEQIAQAGGLCLLGQARQPSYRTSWEAIAQAQPEVLLLMPCGYGLDQVLEEAEALRPQLVAWGLDAVPVWALEANAYFSRPGPRVVDGVELLAQVLHPELFGEPDPSEARRVEYVWA